MNFKRFSSEGPMDEARYNCCVLGTWVLSGPVNIEVAKTYCFKSIKFGENFAVVLSAELSDGVR